MDCSLETSNVSESDSDTYDSDIEFVEENGLPKYSSNSVKGGQVHTKLFIKEQTFCEKD